MTEADSRRPSALVAADAQTAAQATNDAHDGEIARPGANPTDRVVPRLRFPPCEACHRPIDRGYARVNFGDAIERARAYRKWKAAHRRAPEDAGPQPDLIAWEFLHGSCDPDRTAPGVYFINIKMAKTARGLVREILKLSLHPWYEATAWRPMVASILAVSRPPPGEADG